MTLSLSGVEPGATVTVPGMTCTPSPADATGIVTCTGVVGTGGLDGVDTTITVTDPAGNANTNVDSGLVVDGGVTTDQTTIISPTNGVELEDTFNVTAVCAVVGDVITISSPDITPNPTVYTCTTVGTVDIPVTVDPAAAPGSAGTLSITTTSGGITSTPIIINFFVSDGDNVTRTTELGHPNAGDGNGDGVTDAEQDAVTSIPNAENTFYNTLEIPGACADTNGFASRTEISLPTLDPSADYPLGLWEFELDCGVPGETADILIYLDKVYDTSTWIYKKYDNATNIYTDISGSVTYGTALVGGVSVTTIAYSITDGGPLDEDGIANGTIIDPSGPAIPPTVVTSGGNGGAPSRHVVYMCDPETGVCVNRFPTGPSDAFNDYLDCYWNSSQSGQQCAEAWALAAGYVYPADLIATETPIVEPEELPTEIPVEVEVPEKEVVTTCPAIQYYRYPTRRGVGVRASLFGDTAASHPSYAALVDLNEQMIVSGDDGTGYARLDDAISRAETVKIMTIAHQDRLTLGDCVNLSRFPDVDEGAWYHNFVQNMEFQDVVHGYDDGFYRPGKTINKAELYKILALTFDFITYEQAVAEAQSTGAEWWVPYRRVLEGRVDIPASLIAIPIDRQLSRGEAFGFLTEVLHEVDGLH